MLKLYIVQKGDHSWFDQHIVIAHNEDELRAILAEKDIDLDDYVIELVADVKAGYVTDILE